MNKQMIAQANGNFPFTFYIEKAVPIEENGELIVEGVASTTNVDHDQERMSEKALGQMANIINEESVPLRIEHQKSDEAVVGKVYKAWIDSRQQLWIRAALDKANPFSQMLHKSLKEGFKLGLSVGGRVKKATRELVESVGKAVNTFYDIVIDEVSVTQRPANYDAWLFAKSIAKPGDNINSYYSSPTYNQFLFDNPQLDYIQVIAKSIPNRAWVSVEKDSNMKFYKQTETEIKPPEVVKDDVVTETKPTPVEATKDADQPAPGVEAETVLGTAKRIAALEKAMAVGFSKMLRLLKQTAEVTETKPAEAVKQTAGVIEDETMTAKQVADSIVAGEETPLTKDDLADTRFGEERTGEVIKDDTTVVPDTDPLAVGKDAAAEAGVATDEFRETTKQDMGPMVTEGVETTKDDAAATAYGDEYKMPAVKSALRQMDILSQRLFKRQYQRNYVPVHKSVGTIDEFVAAVSRAMHGITKSMEDNGQRLLGLESQIAEFIRNDAVIQKSIKEMMAEPGPKRSVAMGIPYMVTKDGRKFALTANEVGVQKSVQNEGKSFKDVYKTQFSTEAERR